MKPFTQADFEKYIAHIYRPRKPRPQTDDATFKLLHELGIPYFVENGLAMISATSAKKLRDHLAKKQS